MLNGDLRDGIHTPGERECRGEFRGLPLIHDKTVDEWGTPLLGYFMTGPPAGTRYPHPYFANKFLVFFSLRAWLRCKILRTKKFPAKSFRIRSYATLQPLQAEKRREEHVQDNDLMKDFLGLLCDEWGKSSARTVISGQWSVWPVEVHRLPHLRIEMRGTRLFFMTEDFYIRSDGRDSWEPTLR